jgi:hypothetical protein
MGKTFKQEPPAGKEYWSARPAKGSRDPGKATKKFTHHRERRAAVRAIAGEIKEAI